MMQREQHRSATFGARAARLLAAAVVALAADASAGSQQQPGDLAADRRSTARTTALPFAIDAGPPVRALEITPAPAPTAGRPATPHCTRVGPLPSRELSERLVADLGEAGLRSSLHDEVVAELIGYIVLAPAGPPARTRALLDDMRAAGVADVALIGRGEYHDRISLGVYAGIQTTERRQRALARRGFETERLMRTRSRRAWWVEIAAAHASEPLVTVAGGHQAEPIACRALLTASR